jgi:hypothetical protein
MHEPEHVQILINAASRLERWMVDAIGKLTSDCPDDVWGPFEEALKSARQDTNTGSPKMPTLEETQQAVIDAQLCEHGQVEITALVKWVHDYMCHQVPRPAADKGNEQNTPTNSKNMSCRHKFNFWARCVKCKRSFLNIMCSR